ncbi:MAG: cysteine--tRNA ligase [bacterium]
MLLQIYNTFTQKKEIFKPIVFDVVKMYVCGITPYDDCHIGHARAGIVFDMIKKYLIYKGYKVEYITNFTDVDDKIINKANSLNKSVKEIAEKYIEEYFKDIENLGIEKACFYPKVTEHMKEIIDLIKNLIEKDFAYNIDGNVFFEVKKFKNYGMLSKRTLEEMQSGVRIEINEKKRSPLDFALWKSSKPNEIFWESPWGKGRPGWHIECSAISLKYLGETFDIHGGGQDLIFPHHENEIAQSEAATGKKFVSYWVHNGFVKISGEKMSKSLGNFFTIKQVLNLYKKEVIRFFILSSHYRSPLDFSLEKLEEAKNGLERISNSIKRIDNLLVSFKQTKDVFENKFSEFNKKIEEIMDDDFNAAKAIGIIFEFIKEINLYIDKREQKINNIEQWNYLNSAKNILINWTNFFGIYEFKQKIVSQAIVTQEIISEEIEKLIKQRENARKEKKYAQADEIRKQLQEMNIILEDTSQGTIWSRKQ